MIKDKVTEVVRKTHTGKKGDFFVNFYATLSGVFVSLICANWISGYNEQRDVEQALEYVKQELIENQKTVNKIYKQIRLEKTSMRYIYKYADKLDEIPKDSFQYYGQSALRMVPYNFSYDALESMKMSGLFSKIPQQKLAFSISKAYTSIQSIQELYDIYMERKTELKKELKDIKEIKRLPGFADADYWKVYLKYDEGYLYLTDLPMLQASATYRMHMKTLKESLELFDVYESED